MEKKIVKQEKLSTDESASLFKVLQKRFENNLRRHEGLDWPAVQAKLERQPDKVWSLAEMEKTGGEPDVVILDTNRDEWLFVDCSAESPQGRRSLCYDQDALAERKSNKPEGSAQAMAADMGISLLTEAQYLALQTLDEFDLKTSSWLQTPEDIRALGGALFGDKRYGRVFVYHNGAQSYYAARGFRGVLRL